MNNFILTNDPDHETLQLIKPIYKSLNDIKKKWKVDKKFKPRISTKKRRELIIGWSQAIRKTLIH